MDQKHDILGKLAFTIYGFKAYPSDKEVAKVAEVLVAKHLFKRNTGWNWNGWKNWFKLGQLQDQGEKGWV